MTTPSGNPQPPPKRPRRKLHWSVVAAFWAAALGWVLLQPLIAARSMNTLRLLNSITLMLVAAASIALMAWFILARIIEPINDYLRAYELGYVAGKHDATSERQTRRGTFGVVTNLPTAQPPVAREDETGTHGPTRL